MSHYILLRHNTCVCQGLDHLTKLVSLFQVNCLLGLMVPGKYVTVIKQHSAPEGSFLDCLESSRSVGMVGE